MGVVPMLMRGEQMTLMSVVNGSCGLLVKDVGLSLGGVTVLNGCHPQGRSDGVRDVGLRGELGDTCLELMLALLLARGNFTQGGWRHESGQDRLHLLQLRA